MTLRTGLARQIGYAAETTYGIPVAPARFLPLVSNTLAADIDRIESDAIIAGRLVLDSTQWAEGSIKVAGDVGHELYDRGIGLLLKWMFGSLVTTGAGPYTHTATPADLAGTSFTTQLGEPDVNGTVRPITYPGCKVGSWQIAWKEGEKVTHGLSLMPRAEYRYRQVADGATTSASAVLTSVTGEFSQSDIGCPISGTGIPAATTILSVESATSITLSANATATGAAVTVTIGLALGAASYPSGLVPFRALKTTATLGGTTLKVISGTLSGDNKLEERRFDGSPYTDEPLENDHREYSGSVEVEFENLTNYNRYVNASEVALVVVFSAGVNRTLTFTCNIRLDKAKRNPSKGVTKLSLPFKCIGTTDALAITAVAVNSDAAA